MSKVNRVVLESFYQQPGQLYDDTKTEGALVTLADAIDTNDDERINVMNSHKNAAVLDHADRSVTRQMVAVGAIGKDELDPTLWEQTAYQAK